NSKGEGSRNRSGKRSNDRRRAGVSLRHVSPSPQYAHGILVRLQNAPDDLSSRGGAARRAVTQSAQRARPGFQTTQSQSTRFNRKGNIVAKGRFLSVPQRIGNTGMGTRAKAAAS